MSTLVHELVPFGIVIRVCSGYHGCPSVTARSRSECPGPGVLSASLQKLLQSVTDCLLSFRVTVRDE